ncbi:MAG TPA: YiiX/YebB-like N1pC/P60 family cysteine hydrolase [Opitutaceae bacterium]|nr:YiiX/YebB-like N1pC/P60 family cysteine hydrolase [Opitutaceae bacterium]
MGFAVPKISFGLVLALLAGCSAIPRDYPVQEGDILFQPLPHGALVDAIEGVSTSIYSHCGIVERKNGEWYVLEAIGPVQETRLGEWIRRGRGDYFDAYRLKAGLRPQIPSILAAGRTYLGRPYDIRYEFDDERIYCSELIFKAVKSATGVSLGKVQRLGDLNWQPHEAFIRSIESYVPTSREMITPQSLSEAPELTPVFSTVRRAKK